MFVGVAQAASNSTDGAHTEVAGHGAEAGGAFPPFDPEFFASQILWLAITFGAFYWLISRIIAPRIAGILETRHDRIAEDLDEANRLKDESDASIAAYEQELADARLKSQEIAVASREKAKADSDAERAKHEDALNKRLVESEAHVADVKAKALAEVDAIASDTAQAIVEELIGAKPTKAELTKAVSAAAE